MLNTVLGNQRWQTELETAALEVIRSGQYILGKEVTLFEEKCSNYIGALYSVGVSSGTDALLLCLMTLGIGPGDEVICPSFTFFATAGVISRVGAKPVFVDVLLDCFTMDPVKVKSAITDKTKAIIPVHLFGQCSNIEALRSAIGTRKITIIEDAAQAIGTSNGSTQVGTLGELGCFSFFPSKNLGGLGDSGLVTTNDKNLAEELRCMRVHGGKQRYYHDKVGGNFRIDTLQAAMLRVKLKYLTEEANKRKENAAYYLDNVSNERIVLPKEVRGSHSWNQFTLRVLDGRRSELIDLLNKKEIGNAIYYPLPLHKQECFKHLGIAFDMKVTDLLSEEVLSIPIAPELTKDQLQFVAETLSNWR